MNINKIHNNETIFIIGSGNQLNELKTDEIYFLKNSTSIGLNSSSYIVPSKYLVSAYPHYIQMAQMLGNDSGVKYIQFVGGKKILAPRTFPIQTRPFYKKIGLEKTVNSIAPYVRTLGNVALAATHMAYIMGAKNIVYVATDHRSLLQYYFNNEKIRKAMIDNFLKLVADQKVIFVHKYINKDWFLKKLTMSADDAKNKPFVLPKGKKVFSDYIEIIKKNGVALYSTVEDSLVCDSGAKYMPLEYFMKREVALIKKNKSCFC